MKFQELTNKNIGLVLTLITNIQLEKFAEFIYNLPKKT
ncbi:hypothetical protein RAT170B_0585 [Rickettsia argasii T170-B]|uniref:Uncharacterized protein n=1 Tax=Rickettsia argasii T170-B TaxID=1268837 RepID=A0A0F3REL7_9RICK|nr:hypothetical protein RAT170B_0585 [Rickettsia argasii T170-B]